MQASITRTETLSSQVEPNQETHLRLVSPDNLQKVRVAVVDDDEAILLYLTEYLRSRGMEVEVFQNPVEFMSSVDGSGPGARAFSERFSLVLSDVRMPEMSGIEVSQRLRTLYPDVPVILMTAYAEIDQAILAIREGVYDYIEKPFDLERLGSVVRNALRLRAAQEQSHELLNPNRTPFKYGGVLCESPAMKIVYETVARVAPSASSVMITGESGVGKELIARALHENSQRVDHPFVAVNCTAIPESLLESELFGHSKGSFTGATQSRQGLFEAAHGGTLFLDEIGDLNIALQSKILRALQEKKIRPVGDNRDKEIDVRIVSATHRNLVQEIKSGRFREDLYYRLNVIPVHIPPLRQRLEDVPVLANHLLKAFAEKSGRRLDGFTVGAVMKLVQMPLRGNVRELQNIIERSVVFSTRPWIDAADIPTADIRDLDDEIGENIGLSRNTEALPETLKETLKEIEYRHIQSTLTRAGGKKDTAAKALGLSRRTLYRRLQRKDKDKELPRV